MDKIGDKVSYWEDRDFSEGLLGSLLVVVSVSDGLCG